MDHHSHAAVRAAIVGGARDVVHAAPAEPAFVRARTGPVTAHRQPKRRMPIPPEAGPSPGRTASPAQTRGPEVGRSFAATETRCKSGLGGFLPAQRLAERLDGP